MPLRDDNPSPIDLLGFEDVVNIVEEIVLRRDLDPVTVGVNAPWGGGKTTVLQLLKARLDQRKDVLCLLVSPWEYDNKTDPTTALIDEVLGRLETRLSNSANLLDNIKETLHRLRRRVKFGKALKLAASTALSATLPGVSSLIECGAGKPDQIIPTGAYGKALPIDKLGDASKYWNYDPAAAKALLAEAGFGNGFETSMVYTPQYGEAYQSSAERAIQDFAAVGIKVNPKSIQYNEWIGSLYRPPFGFDGILWGPRRYYTDVDPYLWYWLHPEPTQGISNQSRVNDQGLVPLLEKQRQTFEEPARLETIGQIQKIVAEQQYYVCRTTGNSYAFWSAWMESWGATLGHDLPQVESTWDGRL